ncbi:long-chain fatty acid--CoA ligase [Herbaspirillum sp. HC18]|nr:long-chain fatty acid--CoA ligase [Herbaspirillum sp. HC18]
MTTEAAHDMPISGMRIILDDIEQRLRRSAFVEDALNDILSFCGRLPLRLGVRLLTPLQSAFRDVAGNLPFFPIGRPVECAADAEVWYIGAWSFGRIWLAHEIPDDPECRMFGFAVLPTHLQGAVRMHAEKGQQAWKRCDAQMERFFADQTEETLANVLSGIHEEIDHIDPVLLYIGDAMLTNFGKFNNLQERNGVELADCFFRRLRKTPVSVWTREEKTFIFCFHWLRAAGCSGEEFNGCQINPALLDNYFDHRLREYGQGGRGLLSGKYVSIEEKARLLARCKAERGRDMMTYRRVNGINFNKEERLCPRALADMDVSEMPRDVSTFLLKSYGIDSASFNSVRELFKTCIVRMAESCFSSDRHDMHAFEELLKVIVDSALGEVGGDIGMTRGFRDVLLWQQAFAAKAYEDICNRPSGDYYCGVFPGALLTMRLSEQPELLERIFSACAGRMQLNGWHYTPGHCPRESVPASRHFYWPPRSPEMAQWSDQHRAVHVHAEARFAIRIPIEIEIDRRGYAGMIDLRLFRQRGEAFSEEEFFCALHHAECLRTAYQAFTDHVVRIGRSVRISAFDKAWYRRCYGRRGAGDVPAQPARQVPASDCDPSGMVGELYRILHHPAIAGRTALVESLHGQTEHVLTYASLAVHAARLGDFLRRRNIAAGTCISVLSKQPLRQAAAIIAGLACGAVVNPVDPDLPEALLLEQLRHAQPELVIADGESGMPEECARLFPVICWNGVFDDVAASADMAQPAIHVNSALADEHAGLLVYAFGPDRELKGVLLGWRQIRANVNHAILALGYEAGWVAGSMLSCCHTFTLVSDILSVLFLGGKAILVDAFRIEAGQHIVGAFNRHAVQSYSATPDILESLCGLREWEDASALRFAVARGASLKEKTRLIYTTAFGHPVIPCYGLSEATCFAAISPVDNIRPGAVGKPAGIEMCVFDPMGSVAPRGATGELAMRGPSVIRDGYFRDRERRFARAFTSDGWFLTGDIGRIDQDGYVFVTGRKKAMAIPGRSCASTNPA